MNVYLADLAGRGRVAVVAESADAACAGLKRLLLTSVDEIRLVRSIDGARKDEDLAMSAGSLLGPDGVSVVVRESSAYVMYFLAGVRDAGSGVKAPAG